MSRTPPLPVTFGRYVLRERIAAGGMAEVFRAGLPGFGGFERSVAIKRMFRHLGDDPSFVTMLADEARLASQLSHPNIASILDFGREGDDWFLAYELVEGVDLFRLLQRQYEQGQDLPIGLAIFVVAELASALDFAHARRAPDGAPLGIIHRDVSPQNVLVGFRGEVKLTDFGIAKAAVRTSQTAAGQRKGKLYYMSPEAARGDPIDHRADLFAAGILLFELLCTRPLYDEADPRRLLDAVCRADVRWPPDKVGRIPAALFAIANRALARAPGARFATGRALREALLEAAAAEGVVAEREALGAWVRGVFGVADDRPPGALHGEGAGDAEHWSVIASVPPPTAPERPQARSSTQLPRPAPGRTTGPAPRPRAPVSAAEGFDGGDERTAMLDAVDVDREPPASEPPPLPTVAGAAVTAAPTTPLRPAAPAVPPLPPARPRRPSLLRVAAIEEPAPAQGAPAQAGIAASARASEPPPVAPAGQLVPAPAAHGPIAAAGPHAAPPERQAVPRPPSRPSGATPPPAGSESATRFVAAMEDAPPVVAPPPLDPDDAPASWALIAATVAVWSAVVVLGAYATLLLVR